jgi:methylated-DNA-[protein]-cysteine S-methyltransferase
MTQQLLYDEIASPIGKVLIATLDGHLIALDFADYEERMHRLLTRRIGPFALARKRNPAGIAKQVHRYFQGELHALNKVPLALLGTTFQERAWHALRTIRPGQVATYAEQALMIGAPNAARAVGHANGQNPIAIAIPCHRVIGANRSLTGYAGGLDRKRWLLAHEGVSIE